MSITFEKLSKENWESLHSITLGLYLDGQCYEFAAALHRGLGWPMVGFMKDSIIRHALVKSRYGKLWDVRGPVDQDKIGIPFGIKGPYDIKPITEDDLRNTRDVAEEAIERASLFAEALWPELSWRKHTFRRKATSFVAELETLCRKHGIWIRAPFPAHRIVLDKICGDEKGFRFSPALDGQYFFDRELQ